MITLMTLLPGYRSFSALLKTILYLIWNSECTVWTVCFVSTFYRGTKYSWHFHFNVAINIDSCVSLRADLISYPVREIARKSPKRVIATIGTIINRPLLG